MNTIGNTVIAPTSGVTSRALDAHQLVMMKWHSGPYGNPLLFITPDMQGNIGLSDEVYNGLTTEQQVWADAAGRTWTNYAALWADVSAQSWFNTENVMGTLNGGIAFYPDDTSRATLNRGLVWFGLPPVTENLLWLDGDVLPSNDDLLLSE